MIIQPIVNTIKTYLKIQMNNNMIQMHDYVKNKFEVLQNS